VQLHIGNEYDRLEAVLVHRPGPEIDRLTHDNMREFLFEDIPYLKRLQEEHDAFVEQMRANGIRVLHLEALLADLLREKSTIRRDLVQDICAAAQAPTLAATLLDGERVPSEELTAILFKGLTLGEYAELTGTRTAGAGGEGTFILPPIPNAYFSRDPAVVVRDSVISCKMHYVQRSRETKLVRAVCEHHPEFTGHAITYGGSEFPTEDRPFTIEGGDVIILNEESVLVGASERTRSATIEVLAQKAFDVGHVQRFYEIPIPTERLFMHLDTVFTIIDRGKIVWYPGVMENLKHILHYECGPAGGVIRKPDERGLLRILSDEFGKEVEVIETGGGDAHFASREQRTDGTNVFAIAPGKVISYDRNERTISALEAAGVECIRIAGSELVRGLGGPRCMTMPLRRAADSQPALQKK
jgi:arginine deiminase